MLHGLCMVTCSFSATQSEIATQCIAVELLGVFSEVHSIARQAAFCQASIITSLITLVNELKTHSHLRRRLGKLQRERSPRRLTSI